MGERGSKISKKTADVLCEWPLTEKLRKHDVGAHGFATSMPSLEYIQASRPNLSESPKPLMVVFIVVRCNRIGIKNKQVFYFLGKKRDTKIFHSSQKLPDATL